MYHDAALVRRGHLTVWFTDEAAAAWHAPAMGECGGQRIYSDIAIETGLALRLVLHQPLRQTEGALRSITELLGVRIRSPDHTTFSRRSRGLLILPKRMVRDEPLHVLVDSTGVKIYGEGKWLDEKHGVRSPRRWPKLHVAVDADTHEIVAVELTVDDVGDVSMIPYVIDQIEGPVGSMTADRFYNGQVVYDAVTQRYPDATPRSTAVASETPTSQRDRHLQTIAEHGRINWQRSSGFCRRSLVETAMYRYKLVPTWSG